MKVHAHRQQATAADVTFITLSKCHFTEYTAADVNSTLGTHTVSKTASDEAKWACGRTLGSARRCGEMRGYVS
jgi:hypothetical protein